MNKSNIRQIENYRLVHFAEFALQHAADCIYWIMPDASFFYVNDAACAMLGYTREELLALHVYDIDPLVSKEIWQEHWEKIRIDKYFHVESQHRTKDGRILDIEVRANYLQFEGGEYNCAIVRDITARKKMEDLLRLDSAMLENMVEGVVLVGGDDGIIIYANRQFASMFGYSPGELAGKHVSILNSPTDKNPEDTATEIISALHERGVWSGEIRNIRKDGTTFWTHANVARFEHTSYGTVWVSNQHNITTRKESEMAVKKNIVLSWKIHPIAYMK